MAVNGIRKRDGKVVPFNADKITDVIFKAAAAVGGTDRALAEKLSDKVVKMLESEFTKYRIPSVEDVQDAVEKILIENGHAKTAKAYILYRQGRSKIREDARKILDGRFTRMYKQLSLNALRVLAGRYLMHDLDGHVIESPEEMLDRVARTLADIETTYGKSEADMQKLYNDFKEVMLDLEFLPAGRTLANAGASTRLVSNCIVLHMEDSMAGIFETLKNAAQLQQAGSGLGFPFHLLRPAGTSAVRSRGVASGPVSFLRVYDKAFGVIKQQGRHGANMAVMKVTHPDILEYIHCKAKEGEIKNFNISVAVTDEFLEKVMNNDPYPWLCEWRGHDMKPRRIVRDAYDHVVSIQEETLTARELMEEIISAAWSNGEPGIIFIDAINRTNPVPGLGPIEACNPCVTGDSLVSTENGLMRMETLSENYGKGGISVVCDNRIPIELHDADGNKVLVCKGTKGTQLNSITAAWKSGTKDVWRIETESGYELEVTADHKIMTAQGWVEAGKLEAGQELLIQSGEGRFSVNHDMPFDVQNEFIGDNGRIYRYNFPSQWNREIGQFLGWLVGDGWIRHKKKEWMVGLTFGKDDRKILEHIKAIGNKIYGVEKKEIERQRNTCHLNYGSKYFVEYIEKLGVKPLNAGEKEVPASVFSAPKETVSGFLQGMFSSDGTVMLDEKKGNYYTRLTTKSMKLAKQVQLLLLNFGIKSKIYDRSRMPREQFIYETRKGEKRTYVTDGILFEVHIHGRDIERFYSQIGFLCGKNKEKMEKILQKNLKEDRFTDKVKTVEYTGKKDVYELTEPATHSFVANGFVVSNCGEQFLHDGDVCNLGSINLDKFAKGNDVDWERLEFVTRTATRMLDNVIDITDFPVDKVNKVFRSNRRIGLGIMGFGDLLYRLRIPYNSEEGVKMAEKVMKFINDTTHKISQELAEEKGAFPNWQLSIFYPDTKMRNAALTCIAPTGSISMICDVSSGVEPYFALVYVKSQVMGGQTLYYVNKHLEKELKERGLYSEALMDKIAKTGSVQNIAEIPGDIRRVFVTALDISPEDHMRMQAAFQKHVDNSISKTCNFPYEATKEDVLRAYLSGWQLGCKSLTVYRSGSRQVEVLQLVKKEEEKEIAEEQIKAEPQILVAAGPQGTSESCPECSGRVEFTEGCKKCVECGWGICAV